MIEKAGPPPEQSNSATEHLSNAASALSFERSHALNDRARRVIWKGGKESTQHEALHACGFPRFVTRSAGNKVWDADGNCYIDYLMAWGAVLLGHGFAEVERAVSNQLAQGTLMNLAVEHEVSLAERLVHHIPGAELVRFVASGSEATNAAVRIARHVTGREKIIQYGFHGWLDWCQNAHPAGILPAVTTNTVALRYNDLPTLQELFAVHRDEIACVILEPVKEEEPADGYLGALGDIVHQHGALLIFDEAKTGFRFGLGGAQDYYHVTPDLSVFSKALANGYPLALVAGKAEVLERASDVWISGTFHGWPPAIVAAAATLTVLEREPVTSHIWALGQRLIAGVNAILVAHGFQTRLAGSPPMPKLSIPDWEVQAIRRLISKLVERGYFIHPTHPWFISYAHDAACIENTLQDIDAAARELEAP